MSSEVSKHLLRPDHTLLSVPAIRSMDVFARSVVLALPFGLGLLADVFTCWRFLFASQIKYLALHGHPWEHTIAELRRSPDHGNVNGTFMFSTIDIVFVLLTAPFLILAVIGVRHHPPPLTRVRLFAAPACVCALTPLPPRAHCEGHCD